MRWWTDDEIECLKLAYGKMTNKEVAAKLHRTVHSVYGMAQRCKLSKQDELHGYSRHPLYRVWIDIKTRCYNKNSESYRWYGAKGVKMNRSWKRSARKFIEWSLAHGWQQGLEIDRIESAGDYEPSNCRFITSRENCNNFRNGISLQSKRDIIQGLVLGNKCNESYDRSSKEYKLCYLARKLFLNSLTNQIKRGIQSAINNGMTTEAAIAGNNTVETRAYAAAYSMFFSAYSTAA